MNLLRTLFIVLFCSVMLGISAQTRVIVVCFDEPSGTWIALVHGKLDLMCGYIQVATSTPSITGAAGTVDFSGKFNTGAYSMGLTRTEGKSRYVVS